MRGARRALLLALGAAMALGPPPVAALATAPDVGGARLERVAYTDLPGWEADDHAAALTDDMGWSPLAFPDDFEPPDLIDIDAWLDAPGPLSRPAHGSLTPVPRSGS